MDRTADIVRGSGWVIDGQELVHKEAGNGEQWIVFGDPQWKDYEFSFEFKHTRSGDGLDVLFRSPSNDQITHWGTGWLGQKAILEYADSKSPFNPLHSAPKVFAAMSANEWHLARTRVVGKTLTCHLDDVLVWSLQTCHLIAAEWVSEFEIEALTR